MFLLEFQNIFATKYVCRNVYNKAYKHEELYDQAK